MNDFFSVQMLPARQGDSLWIEYGDDATKNRIIIDAGTPEMINLLKEKIIQLPEKERHFELLVITHVDNDHIGGMLELSELNLPGLVFDDIWFNGWQHLPGSGHEEFGPVQGEFLTKWLLQPGRPWNEKFNRESICVPDEGIPPSKDLPGGMKLTLLSPGKDELSRLRPKWEQACLNAGIDRTKPMPSPEPVPEGFESMGVVDIDALARSKYKEDTSEANGSSIALLAEFNRRKLLLGGDLEEVRDKGKLRLDALKLPHHGSRANLSKGLLEKIECKRYLFSTDGTQFKHPDREAVARVIKFGGQQPELLFNYHSEFTSLWHNSNWMEKYGYSVSYSANEQEGMKIDL
jgi:hypothetical protein